MQEMGIDRQGVKKYSRFWPMVLVIVTIVIFIAEAIRLPVPELKLKTVESQSQLSQTGNHQIVVTRLQEGGKEDRLIFQHFDGNGEQRREFEEDITTLAQGKVDEKKVKHDLVTLKGKLSAHWGNQNLATNFQVDVINDVLRVTRWEGIWTDSISRNIHSIAVSLSHDSPRIVIGQLKTIWVLFLYSLAPGVLGLICRRAFWKWFLTAFVILFLINWGYRMSGTGSITPNVAKDLWDASGVALVVRFAKEVVIFVLLIVCLRRHSVAAIDQNAKRKTRRLGALLVLLAIVVFLWTWKYATPFSLHCFEGISIVVMLVVHAYALVSQSESEPVANHGKNIVVCLDGTWNQPGQKDFGYLAETNVFKLFMMLKGTTSPKHYNASRCKEYLDENQFAKQIAFYYHGVGNTLENSELGQLLGGVFGMGADAIVARAYLDVVRVYRPGDRIFLFGFSRGAAIARLLAGVIGRRGVPNSLWTLNLFFRHWLVWASSKAIENVPVEVLGCWDTVGAFGISKNILGIPFQKVNLLKDLSVSLCVKRAYHLVALDETRDSFEPTLMEPDPISPNRVIEVWFSGNHSNVGGGYATDKLSNVTLDFMLSHVSSGYARDGGTEAGKDEAWGLYLSAVRKGQGFNGDGAETAVIDADPRGQIRHSTGAVYSHAPRRLPIHAVIYDSVFDRMRDALPVYAPQSLFNLNEELVKKRRDIETGVERLAETRSLHKEECDKIRNWSNEKLSLMKWSEYLASDLDDKIPLREKLKPAEELSNLLMHQTASVD